jgi:hypothetical protein
MWGAGLYQNQHDLKIAINSTLPAWQQSSLLYGRSLRIWIDWIYTSCLNVISLLLLFTAQRPKNFHSSNEKWAIRYDDFLYLPFHMSYSIEAYHNHMMIALIAWIINSPHLPLITHTIISSFSCNPNPNNIFDFFYIYNIKRLTRSHSDVYHLVHICCKDKTYRIVLVQMIWMLSCRELLLQC